MKLNLNTPNPLKGAKNRSCKAPFRGLGVCLIVLLNFTQLQAQDTVRYVGQTLSNVDYHHGQLSPAVGVHNIQVFRANREHPELAGGTNWTYNHAPMLAYWNNTFYLQYLSNPVGEHVAPGQTLLLTSKDGYSWSKPTVIFPPYKVPDGWKKPGRPEVAKDLYAVMHQRMGFYVAKNKRLLTLAFYGLVMGPKDDPNDGNGIGRVVREIYPDGKYGPIYFIRHNASWDQSKSVYPFYTSSNDKGFVEACDELLANPLMMQQWVEEADRNDPLITLKKDVKAFSYYYLPDNRVVGLWKHALTTISSDGGKTWQYNPLRAPGFVNSNAKIWGQKTSDGNYATVYNPSEFRWPLAVSTSKDGLNYTNLLLVNGEITAMRYGGAYKSYGPQYVRGIEEGNGTPPDGSLWVTYSMNKEDIWVSSIPMPITDEVKTHPDETFAQLPAGEELKCWNIYSPLQARAQLETIGGSKALVLRDKDKFDFAKAERIIPESKKLTVEFSIVPQQANKGVLQIEFQDAKGTPAVRLLFDSDSLFKAKVGYRDSGIQKYEAGKQYDVRIELDREKRMFTTFVNGQPKGNRLFFAPVASFRRVVFRTGGVRRFPDADTPTDQNYDLPKAGEQDDEAVFVIKSFKTSGLSSRVE
ncbi:six-hairpin glycosidase [Spirosoma sp. HMF3257]|uniref:Six-hairpin glycosidase n=1 Tax=Spirosoma telluris TaxID=2183553 RepID=A0A327NI28_9BACT|nr:six-hairpin glycosidase [Spirosoma telluris]RAI73676.1 six-hairpin glycosidase [Spirosoma telluris]